ncbi:MAG: hypothetical protein WC529_05835 [Candidatus Margulisiibacteriota bacterium]
MSTFLTAAIIFSLVFVAMAFFLGHSVLKKKAKLSELISESTILLVLATIIIGSIQLHVLDKTSKAQFLLDLKETFYEGNPLNNRIMEAIDYGELTIVERTPAGRRPPETFSDYEVDQYLINFDYINIYASQGIIDLQRVNEIFGWYVRKAWGNKAIQAYIKRIRRDEPTVYRNFEQLAGALKRGTL